MCVHCTSPVAAVVSPVLPSSRKAARPGRELELHVAPAASLSRRAVPVPKARPDTSEGSLSLCQCDLPNPAPPAVTEREPISPQLRPLQGFAQPDQGSQPASGMFPARARLLFPPLPGSAGAEQGVEMPAGYHDAVDARSKRALGAGGWCVPYFCQPLEEYLFSWLGFFPGRLACLGLEGAQKCILEV